MQPSRTKKHEQSMDNDGNRSIDDCNSRLPDEVKVMKSSHSKRSSSENRNKRGHRPSSASDASPPVRKRNLESVDASMYTSGRNRKRRVRGESSSDEDSESEGSPPSRKDSSRNNASTTESADSGKPSVEGPGAHSSLYQYPNSLLSGGSSLMTSNLLSGLGRSTALPSQHARTFSLSQSLLLNQARQQLLDQQLQSHAIQQSLGGLNMLPSMSYNQIGPYVPGYVWATTPYQHQPLLMMLPHGHSPLSMPFSGLPLREQAILIQQNQQSLLLAGGPASSRPLTLHQPQQQLLGQQLSGQPSRQIQVSQSPVPTASSQDKERDDHSNEDDSSATKKRAAASSDKESSREEKTRMLMYIQTDDGVLSEYQILLRQNIEFFQAARKDVETTTPGRKKPIVLGQVGIRCIHCGPSPAHHRTSAAVYFPSRLGRLYQSAQNIGLTHFGQSCTKIDSKVREKVKSFHDDGKKATAGHGGKDYWSNAARAQGVIETGDMGLRFEHSSVGNTSE